MGKGNLKLDGNGLLTAHANLTKLLAELEVARVAFKKEVDWLKSDFFSGTVSESFVENTELLSEAVSTFADDSLVEVKKIVESLTISAATAKQVSQKAAANKDAIASYKNKVKQQSDLVAKR